jgi:ubiquinone biosynthesis protein
VTRVQRLAGEAEQAIRNLARLAEAPPAPVAVAVAETRRGGGLLWFALGAVTAGAAFLATALFG